LSLHDPLPIGFASVRHAEAVAIKSNSNSTKWVFKDIFDSPCGILLAVDKERPLAAPIGKLAARRIERQYSGRNRRGKLRVRSEGYETTAAPGRYSPHVGAERHGHVLRQRQVGVLEQQYFR